MFLFVFYKTFILIVKLYKRVIVIVIKSRLHTGKSINYDKEVLEPKWVNPDDI